MYCDVSMRRKEMPTKGIGFILFVVVLSVCLYNLYECISLFWNEYGRSIQYLLRTHIVGRT